MLFRSTGPSNAYAGSINFVGTLSGNAPTSKTSSAFASLAAGKSYVFDILVWGKSASTALDLNLAVSASGATPTITTHWFVAYGQTYRNNVLDQEHSFMGRVVIDGSSTITNYQLVLTITSGSYISSADAVTLAGGFTGILVGSVTNA